MIFVVVGTTSFPFKRLFSVIDAVLVKINSNSNLIVQTGDLDYSWRYKKVTICSYLSPSQINHYIQKSDRIITHGGFGTMHTVGTQSSFMPLVVPRLHKNGEHVDNHQKYFLEALKEKVPSKYYSYFVTDALLFQSINSYLIKRPHKNILFKYIFKRKPNHTLLKNLEHYIHSL